MTSPLQNIRLARDWREYYEGYSFAYDRVVAQTWALGSLHMVNQLHHTAIPDVSGSIAGSLSWAIYSQPSVESLAAFLPVFGDLLDGEPNRIRSNRYIFVVPDGDLPSKGEAEGLLGPMGRHLDFWLGSLKQELQESGVVGALQSANVLFEWGESLIAPSEMRVLVVTEDRVAYLRALYETAVLRSRDARSRLPGELRSAHIAASFVIAGARMGVTPEELAIVLEDEGGIAAVIATDRLQGAASREHLHFCARLLALSPPGSVEYRVRPGDILSRIVRNYYQLSFLNVWPFIQTLNPAMQDPNHIVAGQVIRLPVLGLLPELE